MKEKNKNKKMKIKREGVVTYRAPQIAVTGRL
jgi:hypothetical protein